MSRVWSLVTGPAGRLLVCVSNLVFLGFALFPPEFSRTLDPARITADEGHAFIQKIRGDSRFPLAVRWSTTHRPNDSNMVVYEDGVPLAHPFATHKEVRGLGQGRYCHCRNKVVFSTPDGSDPRTNGRSYSARATKGMVPDAWLLLAFMDFAWLLLFRLRWPNEPGELRQRLAGFRKRLLDPLSPRIAGAGQLPLAVVAICFLVGAFAVWGTNVLVAAIAGHESVSMALAFLGVAVGLAALLDVGRIFLALGVFGPRPTSDRTQRAWNLAGIPAWLCMAPLFAVPLIYAWTTDLNGSFAFGGLLPWSDAHGYFVGALHFLNTEEITPWNQRRPLNVPWNAVRLAIGGGLQTSQILVAMALAGLTGLAARMMGRRLGRGAAVVFVAVVFANVCFLLRSFLTETNAWPIAMLAWIFLWSGAEKQRPAIVGIGVAFLSLALNARAGPFAVLPALLLWSFFYRGPAGWRLPVAVIAGSTVGFLVQELYAFSWSDGTGQRFGNFSHTLYGLTVGSNWTQIYLDHPEIRTLPESTLYDTIYRHAFAALRENPLGLVESLWKRGLGFVGTLDQYYPVNDIWRLCPLLLPLLWIRDPAAGMVLFASLGMLASAPILFPDGGTRVWAATTPVFAALGALATGVIVALASALAELFHGRVAADPPASKPTREWHLVIGGLAILGLLIGSPFLVAGTRDADGLEDQPECEAGEQRLVTRLGVGGVSVQLLPDDEREGSRSPQVRLSDFRKRLSDGDLARSLAEVSPPAELWMGASHAGNLNLLVLFDPPSSLPRDEVVVLCGPSEPGPDWSLLRNPRRIEAPGP
ncbi:MAG: hypothetical protein GY946_04820 [bacterium]|nr:hypothetical protein [bacterium]